MGPNTLARMGASFATNRGSMRTGASIANIAANTEDFIMHVNNLGGLMQSLTIRDLLNNLTGTLKRVFKVTKVTYLMSCKDAIDQLRKEGGVTLQHFHHAHHSFWVVVPENASKTSYKPNFYFSNMSDVTRMKAITSRAFVAPIFNAKDPEKSVLLAQMEIRHGSNHSFDENRDKRAFEIIGKIVSGILERIFVNARTSVNENRAYVILKTCK